jgi:hypothetical protein
MNDYDELTIRLVPSTTQPEVQQYAAVLKGFGYESISDSFSTPRQVYVERPDSDAALAVFLQFFRKENRIIYVRFNPGSFMFDQSTAERKRMYINFPCFCIPTKIVLDQNPTNATEKPVKLPTPPQLEKIHIYVSLSRSFGDMGCGGASIPGTISAVPVTVAGHHAENWLRSKGIGPESFMNHSSFGAPQLKFFPKKDTKPQP